MPLHAEGRLAWWFGGFAPRTGPRFFLAASGGLAQVDAELPVHVYESEAAYLANRITEYRAFRKTGTGFVALGGGALLALTASSGVLAEVRVMQMLDVGGHGAGAEPGLRGGLLTMRAALTVWSAAHVAAAGAGRVR